MVACRLCGQKRPAREFLDSDGRVSTRCVACREGRMTPAETPFSRKASGLVSAQREDEVLTEVVDEEFALLDLEDVTDELEPVPDTDPEPGKT